MKKLMFALCAFSLLAGSGPSIAAAACRDKHGKFTKCPELHSVAHKSAPCRDKHGKYMKC